MILRLEMILCCSATAATFTTAFSPIAPNHAIATVMRRNYQKQSKSILKAEKDDDNKKTGMDDAFESLGDLSAADFDNVSPDGTKLPQRIESPSKEEEKVEISPKELEKYKDMYQQMEQDEGNDVYSDLLGVMGGSDGGSSSGSSSSSDSSSSDSSSSSSGKGFGKTDDSVMDDADGIGSLSSADDDEKLFASDIKAQEESDEFMEKALKAAMDETQKINSAAGIDPKKAEDSILNDKEIMKEINAIFDRANDQLLDGIKEIREDQAALTKETSAKRSNSLQEEEARLKEAEGSVSRLVDKVKKETEGVEKATRELQAISDRIGEDPLMKAAELKKGGIIKQSALVGAVLFSLRSAGDLAMMGGVDGASHGTSALVQGVIALACAAYLVLF
eukprot:CAMPEP_0194085036 /NCGR_PEP_ID=MMETSP0149-20130528/16120_1 /TAXON_ID=122233 /ORGANISM="Chaetoceros debilis, Strain MM31A-1" /LENGTH=390 /DNA_ID=CAMNT_0038767833 /DNA_START=108 /DNA_END=1280 /DNA_ORIENTATION=-